VPEVRSLPISAAHREFSVKVDGNVVPREHQLLSVSLVSAANRIASARLAYLDGAAAASDFPLSNADLFAPGSIVEISAGAGDDQSMMFVGIVTRHSLRVRGTSAPQLIVECRHAAMKLTIARSNAYYFEQTDAEIITGLLDQAGLSARVESSRVTHKQLVQFHASDWDFLIGRAEDCGKLVFTRADQVVVKAPALTGSPVCTLQYGATIIELDAEIDARTQFASVRGMSWDPAQQAMMAVDAAAPGFSGPGNLSGDDLAGVAALDHLDLRHAAIDEPEAQAWAEAAWLRSRVNKVSGRVKCEGIGNVFPGDEIVLAGAGQRFNGNILVTGVRHEYDLVQGWKTHLQFGGVASQTQSRPDLSAPPAGGLLPGVSGLQIGVVVSNVDPDGEHRVRIKLPLVNADDDGIWARVASLDAGSERGFFFRPEIGDEVVAGFLDADPRCPVILGMLHSSAKAAPLEGSDDNHEKLYRSRSGMRVYFNDDTKVLQLDTPGGNRLTLSEQDQAVVLADQHGNKIEMNADGISIASTKAMNIKAGTELGLESGTSFSAKGGTDLKLEGGTQAELSSAATTKVSGGIVQIN
jgi:Rhs element Vgr protein